jgi:hypothetical protein
MVFNATFNNFSVILWRSALLMETGVPGENHWPVTSQSNSNDLKILNLVLGYTPSSSLGFSQGTSSLFTPQPSNYGNAGLNNMPSPGTIGSGWWTLIVMIFFQVQFYRLLRRNVGATTYLSDFTTKLLLFCKRFVFFNGFLS